MKKIFLPYLFFILSAGLFGQKKACSDPIYRQFDFWIGEWDVFGIRGNKAGDSKISLILDSCVILEEWSSVVAPNGQYNAGKSFNRYNASTKQWQQTWVSNTGQSTDFSEGKLEDNKMIFTTRPFKHINDTMAMRRLSFFNLGPEKVRQLGEISMDQGLSWRKEYDLEYRRKNR